MVKQVQKEQNIGQKVLKNKGNTYNNWLKIKTQIERLFEKE